MPITQAQKRENVERLEAAFIVHYSQIGGTPETAARLQECFERCDDKTKKAVIRAIHKSNPTFG